MKRIPLLSIALTLFIVAGFLLLFPYEVVALGLLLVLLVTVQVVMLRRHLHPIEPARARGRESPNLGEASAPRAESFARAATQARPAQPGPENAPREAPQLPVDGEVFSRFRAQLEAAEQSPAPATAPPSAEPEDRVAISPQARRKTSAEKPPPVQGESPDLFADLVPNPPLAPSGARKSKGAAAPGESQSAPSRQPLPEKARRNRRGATPPATENPPPAAPEGDSAMLLKLVEDALEQSDRAGAAAGIEQLRAKLGRGSLPWRAHLAQARLAVMDGDLAAAVAGFERLLAQTPQPEEDELLAHIGQLGDPLPSPEGDRFRVSLMLKLLARQRQANDREAMDRLYPLIHAAQEKAGDEEKLLQYYKNHLEIKKVMGDVAGQLELIDRIGNRYFKRGDTETAKAFYEQGLKLRDEQSGQPVAGPKPEASP